MHTTSWAIYTHLHLQSDADLLEPYAQYNDRFWGPFADNLHKVVTITSALGATRLTDKVLSESHGVNCDLEGDSVSVRAGIAAALSRIQSYNATIPLSVFVHLNALDADPSIVAMLRPNDILMFGKSMWVSPSILPYSPIFRDITKEAAPYLTTIKSTRVRPGILLGHNYGGGLHYTAAQIEANIRAVVSLGVHVIGFYYDTGNIADFVTALKSFRNNL